MKRIDDLTGQKFGELTVIERVENHISSSGQIRSRWKCLCSCGNTKDIVGHALKKGDTKSCGCKWHSRDMSYKELSGQKFGKLTVIKFSEYRYLPSGPMIRIWECICECGNLSPIFVQESHLKSGHTTSCGCSKIIDLTGQTFGKLYVLKRGESYLNPHGTSTITWTCKCECGKVINVRSSSLKRGQTSCGCVTESWIATKLKLYLQRTYKAIPEYRCIKNPKTGYWLSYDIYIPKNIFIEVHGGQHYSPIPFFHKSKSQFEKRKRIDKLKQEFAKRNGTYIEIDLRKIKTIEDAIAYVEERM